MKLEHRAVEITLLELRKAAMLMDDTLRANETLRAITDDQLPLIHAYLLGWVLRSTHVAPESVSDMESFIQLGYKECDHFGKMKEGGGT